MGLSVPSFRCGLALRGAGVRRNATSAPDGAKQDRIDATCGAAGSCTGLAAGCAQAPRRCRVVSAARRPPPLSVVRCNRRRSSVASCARSLLQALVGASGSSGTVAPYFATCASSTLVATRLRHRRNVRHSAVVATCPSGVIRRTDHGTSAPMPSETRRCGHRGSDPAGGIGALLAAVSLGGPALPPPEVWH